MTRSQVIKKLRAEGFEATVGRIRQALENGYLQPLPKKKARGAYHFTPRHLASLRWYFVTIRPGPMGWEEEWPIEGSSDRMHRLARKKEQQGPAPDQAFWKRGKYHSVAGKSMW
jgi:hypothetical protein